MLHRKGLEASLIQMSPADRAMRNPPTHGMRVSKPAEECGEIPILFWLNDKVPMRLHEAVGVDGDGVTLLRFDQHLLQRLAILIPRQEFEFSRGTIENVVDQPTRSDSRLTCHNRSITTPNRKSKKSCVPIYSPFLLCLKPQTSYIPASMSTPAAQQRLSHNLRHRTDAVARVLRGDELSEIAADLGVPPREIEQWAKEYCRAGEMRLRQLPENFLERCVTSAEKLVPLATLISVVIAVTLFVQGQRKEAADRARVEAIERESRVRDAYTALDDRYLDYVKLCMEHPDLDVFDTPMKRTAPPTEQQRRQESMMLSMLMSVLERAYLMYSQPDDDFERGQWSAWVEYMKSWVVRDNFREEWKRSRKQFDGGFAKYVDSLMGEDATPRP